MHNTGYILPFCMAGYIHQFCTDAGYMHQCISSARTEPHPIIKRMKTEFEKIQLRTNLLFFALILLVSAYITVLLSGRANIMLRENAARLVNASNRQMELNIDSYLTKVEKSATLLFSDDTCRNYDPTDENADAYAQLQAANKINDTITNLSILDNYADFAVIYSNDDILGSLSKITRDMYADGGMYDDFSQITGQEEASAAWVFGLNGDTDHIYYFQRYNPQSIILVSFYSRELKNVFQIPEQLDGMIVSLVNDSNTVLYSNVDEKIGTKVPARIVSLLGDLKNGSVMSKDILITTGECSNGWRVICTLPTDLIIHDNNSFMFRTLLVIMIVVAIFLIYGMFESRRMNRSANTLVDSLQEEAQHDRMTGLYNNQYFRNLAAELLTQKAAGRTMSFTILDMDNFKSINDRHGHLTGDQVLKRFSTLLSGTFGSEFRLGRLGGDEFGVFGCMDNTTEESARKELAHYLHAMRSSFHEGLGKEFADDNLSFCSGTTFIQADDNDFEIVFKRADNLLYEGKKSGKGQDHFDEPVRQSSGDRGSGTL